MLGLALPDVRFSFLFDRKVFIFYVLRIEFWIVKVAQLMPGPPGPRLALRKKEVELTSDHIPVYH